MTEVNQILSQLESGDPSAAEQLLPLVYEELRKLAASKLAQEMPGQTLQATALVHEAYMRVVGSSGGDQQWNGRGHFFGAAAEAMRRILVEQARRKSSLKRGGDRVKEEFTIEWVATDRPKHDVLAVHQALEQLSEVDLEAARLVELRYFAGLTASQAASVLGVSSRTADRIWAYARSFLLRQIERDL